MLQFIRRKKKKSESSSGEDSDPKVAEVLDHSLNGEESIDPAAEDAEASSTVHPSSSTSEASPTPDDFGFFSKLAGKIVRTSSSLGDGIGQILLGKKEIDDELLEDIEMQLLTADVGVETTRRVIDSLTNAIERDALTDPRALLTQLKKELRKSLSNQSDLVIDSRYEPFVILVVGVNGAGKTTTIGKLAKHLQRAKMEVMLAAGDTFRAAAVEQLQVWGDRNQVPVIAQQTGSDSASVIFDAQQSARSRKSDVLIADTAGRLHNKDNLMEELKKVVRVMKKNDETAPHEILLVLDATTGQNAVAQAMKFKEAVGVTGLVVTKLDGTAKGGVVFAIAEQLALPIRFIGVGEKIEDLRPFEPDEFIEAIFEDIKGFQ